MKKMFFLWMLVLLPGVLAFSEVGQFNQGVGNLSSSEFREVGVLGDNFGGEVVLSGGDFLEFVGPFGVLSEVELGGVPTGGGSAGGAGCAEGYFLVNGTCLLSSDVAEVVKEEVRDGDYAPYVLVGVVLIAVFIVVTNVNRKKRIRREAERMVQDGEVYK